MAGEDLAALAQRIGLAALSGRLAGSATRIVPLAEADMQLADPSPGDLYMTLSQMIRRGLDPVLVARAMQSFAGRPVEQGLLAWDVLTGSLVEGERLDELRAQAAVVREVLPPPLHRGLPADARPVELVASVGAAALGSADDNRLLDGIVDHELAAYELFRAQNPEFTGLLTDADDLLGGTLAFTRLIDLAHLPTLAAFYSGYLWRAYGDERALADLAETLLDAREPEFLPSLPTGLELRQPRLVEYVAYRQLLAQGKPIDAKAAIATVQELGLSTLASDAPSRERDGIELFQAELALSYRASVEHPLLDAIVNRNPTWRYAYLVRAALTVRDGDDAAAAAALRGFVQAFGNHAWLWEWAFVREHRAPLAGRLARELTFLPHDLQAWRALVELPEIKDSSVAEELRARVAAQCAL